MSIPAALSCLICSHRAPPVIQHLFNSLMEQRWEPGDEIVFVDNGIADDRLPYVHENLDLLRKKGAHVIYVKEERPGHTNARLKSFAASGNSWLVLLDDDNTLGTGALELLRHVLRENPLLGGICPRIEPIWFKSPGKWIMVLGHHVLSYNHSSITGNPQLFGIWRGGALGARPPGGGMIIHRSAVEAFITMCDKAPVIRKLGRTGSQLVACEDFILYSQLYMLRMPTAYVDGIQVGHHIPESRMKFGYLMRLAFWAHFSFGFLGIMRRGKLAAPYSVFRHTGVLILSIFWNARYMLFWQVPAGYAAMFAGAWWGALKGLLDRDAVRIAIDP